MKPTSNQNARVGKIRKPSHSKFTNIESMLNRIDNSTRIVAAFKTQ
ncbi:hypothetical protein BN863_27060 [Formosa agariphila KMM 3901]|uniref:Uncharacterized protein n=1 Tax=Formosa agariphila (strain DSM 15362 / KCTC 12365 / LMG 23005 / KMM 3901 / M-2Alg 35-1) TaxID=1347342 RepID=T2KPK2_FORAG|nr:hypothetical protein [Formosa agariphila]CDF80418.1 hypothetical protein BN863_27060 [Formosa agariphila KMM 3901]